MRRNLNSPEERAAEEIARMLCGAEETDEPSAEAPTAHETPGTPEIKAKTAEQPDKEREALKAVNRAIEAIGELNRDTVDCEKLYADLMEERKKLISARSRVYGHMVDWNAIAEGR